MPEQRAVVFPMVKHPFVVGFLVAELPLMDSEMSGNEGHDVISYQSPEEAYALPPSSDKISGEIETSDNKRMRMHKFTAEQRSNATNICRSLAMAYVMDQVDYTSPSVFFFFLFRSKNGKNYVNCCLYVVRFQIE